ncbi:patatin-like phospholipase family protein [bacterium SCSIO 12643]|nr:patatin-like phospholipase family protein [bacterium SCSIO 12643]
MKHQIGLALSGGGVKGVVHAGMIHFFDEIGFKPSIISGTSAGAVVGLLYATGHSGEEILHFFLTEKPFSTSFWKGDRGLIETRKIRQIFSKYIVYDDFGRLKCDFKPVATNMLNGTSKVFESGSVIDAVLASAAFPGIFQPMEINDVLYSDGGILNHFPADIIRDECNYLVGMHLSPNKILKNEDLDSTRDILARTVDIQGSEAEVKKLEICDVALFPEQLRNYATFDTKEEKIMEMFKLGYAYAEKHEAQLTQMLSR